MASSFVTQESLSSLFLHLAYSNVGLVVVAALGITLCFAIHSWWASSLKWKLAGIPVVGKSGSNDFRGILAEGQKKYPDQPFFVPFQNPTVIIPASCIDELKNLPDSTLSTNGSQYERFSVKYTNSGWVDPELAHSIKYDLKSSMSSLLPSMMEEIHLSMKTSIPECKEWTKIAVQPVVANMVASVFGRAIVGAPISRDPKWLKASIGHAMAVVQYSASLRRVPSFLRGIYAHLAKEKKVVIQTNKEIKETVTELTRKVMAVATSTEEKEEREGKEGEFEPGQGRLTKWLFARYQRTKTAKQIPSLILRDHYTLCFAAIHGPAFILVQALIDLASYPEFMAPLREEIDCVLKNVGDEDITMEHVDALKFVDSFCKESARMNPQGLIAWLRKTHKPLPLSTGHTIPANTLIAAPNPFFSPSSTPSIISPSVFNPYRWLEAREANTPGHEFGAATTDSLIFGMGKHACPGRPFGIPQVKLTFAEIVRRWDVRLVGAGGGGGRRPENLFVDFTVLPAIPPFGDVGVEFRERR